MKFIKCSCHIPLAVSAVVAILLTCLTIPLCAVAQPVTAQQPVVTVSLENGLTLLFQEDRAQPLIAVEIIVRTGSLYERSRQGAGLAHLVEHMLFKGTATRSASALNEEVRRLGGEINGYTSHQFTGYSLVLPAENLQPGLALLKDMLANPLFDEAELSKEKEVILSEIRMNRDDPQRYVGRLFWQHSYEIAPYNLPVIGLEPLFLQLQRQDLIDFHAQWYMPNNIIIGICGDCSVADTQAAVTEIFGNIPMRPFPDTTLPVLPQTTSATTFETNYEGSVTYLMLGLPSVELTHPDAPVLDIVAAALGDGESSRLYQRLVKQERCAYAVEAFNYTPRFRGMLGFSMVLDRPDASRCEAIILEEATLLGRQTIAAAELDKIKNKYLSEYARGRQTVQAKAGEIASDYAYQSDAQFSRRYMEALSRVSAADVRRCVRNYIDSKKITRVLLSPLPESVDTAAQRASVAAAPDMRRVLLPNGVRLLLNPDASVPVVAAHFIFGGGVRYEQEETNGLFNALSQMLTRGTRRHSSLRLARLMAQNGGTLAPFSGYNSFGISLEILSKNIDRGLELCLDAALQPAFDSAELALLQRQIVKSIDMRQDDIFSFTMDRARQTLFSSLSYRFPAIGNKDAVARLTPELLRAYYRRFCVPENLVISVCGDFDPARVEALLRETVGRLKAATLPAAPAVAETIPTEPRLVEEQKDREQAVVVYAVPGVALRHADRRVLELLNHILTGHGAILYDRIREDAGLAYTLGGNAVAGLDGGYFFIYVATAPENTTHVITLLEEELAKAREQLIPAEMVGIAQTHLISQHAIGLQTQAALGFTAGLDELYGLGYNAHRAFASEIRAITPEQLQAAARAYLVPERSVIVVTKK